MADKITIEQVNDLVTILRSDAPLDTKVQHVTAAKSGIKQHNVPDNAIPILFDALRSASTSQHAVLVNAGFTGLNHLLTRLSRQEPKFLVKEAPRTLPVIIEKLGDQKEKFRTLALQSLVTLYRAAPMDVERSVKNTGMAGKNPRAKEMSMQWLLQMHHEQGLPFRAYVPVLMELLEDADGMVRDATKSTVIDLFRNAPNTAKADLKKQLKNFKVRPAIEQAIVKELAPSPSNAFADDRQPTRPESARAIRPHAPGLSASVSSLSSERPITPMPDRPEQVEPTYVNTHRELDGILRDMHVWFDGRETEQNWLKREESVTLLRRLIAGNASDFQDTFLAGVKALLDGIIKAIVSLRTSLSKEGCSLIQDLANTYGPGIDNMVEILLQTLIKLSAGTKKISSQLASVTVDAIVSQVTYSSRILQHIWGACQDKNVQPRTYATNWLKIVLSKEAHHKERVEHTGGLELIEKSIVKGLNDANPGVRERMRSTYWVFAGMWPARAETIMTNLDAQAQRLLQNDSNNPNSPKRSDAGAATAKARPGLGLSKSTLGAPKPSLRETMMAKRKEAMASRNLPARPGSAMAIISPVRTVSSSSAASTTSTATTRTVGGGLSHAPVRPNRRRPELHARPATAGPYSVRTHDAPSAEQSSPPETLRSKAAVTPKALNASPKRTAARPRPGHQATASESSVPTPSRATGPTAASKAAASSGSRSAAASPRGSPVKPKPAVRGHIPVAGAAAATAGIKAASNAGSPSRGRGREEFRASTRRPPTTSSSPKLTKSVTAPAPIAGAVALPPVLPLEITPENIFDGRSGMVQDDVVAGIGGGMASPPLKVYEDPFSDDQLTPKPTAALFAPTVLEDKPINEDAANLVARLSPDEVGLSAATGQGVVSELARTNSNSEPAVAVGGGNMFSISPEKAKQNTRLLDSGITRVKAQTLDVHGFRKLQGIIRDAAAAGGIVGNGNNGGNHNHAPTKTALFTDERFDALLLGLFTYLESPLPNLAPEKVQDVKAQILATIKLLLKKSRDSFQPHVSRGLEALLATRAGYEARTHIVAGLELLADELVTLGDPSEISLVLTRWLSPDAKPLASPRANPPADHIRQQLSASVHAQSMGLHVLKVLVEARPAFQPTDSEMAHLAGLAQRCLDSSESGVRMDAVQLCVALHERVGDARFWGTLRGVKDDPKSLITYYIVKQQREQGSAEAR